MSDIYSFIFIDLLFPAVVAVLTAQLSYKAAYNLVNKQTSEQRKREIADYLENMIINFDQLSSVMDKLTDDVKNLPFYSVANRTAALQIISRLRELASQISIIGDNEKRRAIVERIETIFSLISEIDSLENFEFAEKENLRKIREALNDRFDNLRIEIMKHDIIIDDNGIPVPISNKGEYSTILESINPASQAKSEQIQSIINNYIQQIRQKEQDNSQLIERNKERRMYLAVKAVSESTAIKELISRLKR